MPSLLYSGASAGVARLIEVLQRGPEDGLLVPIPQYPLYAGLLTRIGGKAVGYYLDVGVCLFVTQVISMLKCNYVPENMLPRTECLLYLRAFICFLYTKAVVYFADNALFFPRKTLVGVST